MTPFRAPSPGEFICSRCGDHHPVHGSRWRWMPGHITQQQVCGGCAVELDAEAKARLDAACGSWRAMAGKDTKR